MFTKKIAVVSVINDLVSDTRVNKTCMTLMDCNYEIVLIGRKLANSKPVPAWPFKTVRMALFFNKGPAFYLSFNFRLFWKLLFTKCDLLFSNDLDTLLPNYLVSRIKNIPLIYDSHELFCEVPELQDSKTKKAIWESLEKFIVPKLKTCITVSDSIAKVFEERYRVKFTVVRNITPWPKDFVAKSREELGLPKNKKIVLMQGAGINIDRGAEELVEAMEELDGVLLLIIGGGDVWERLKLDVRRNKLEDKVRLIDKLLKDDLRHYTANADLGLSIDKNTNPNYYYSLPNKLFDYIHAGIPVLASRLPEIEKLLTHYKVGDFIANHKPDTIAGKLRNMLDSAELIVYKRNTKLAATELNWDNERKKLIELIEGV